MPLTVKINVAVREQICQKIVNERVNNLSLQKLLWASVNKDIVLFTICDT